MHLLLVSLHFLTPKGALLGLLVLLPLAAFLAISRRASGVRQALGVPDVSESARVVPLVAVVAVGVLLGLAAAQPLIERSSERKVRSDAEAYRRPGRHALDARPAEPPGTDAHRAREAGGRAAAGDAAGRQGRRRIADQPGPAAPLPERRPGRVPGDPRQVGRGRAARAGTGFIIAPGQVSSRNATVLARARRHGDAGLLLPEARKRVAVVLTDGESPDVGADRVASSFRRAGIHAVYLRFWGSRERVFTNGDAEPQYRRSAVGCDPWVAPGRDRRPRRSTRPTSRGPSGRSTGTLAPVAAEAEATERGHRLPLAPYLAAVAIPSAGLLLWRRDR